MNCAEFLLKKRTDAPKIIFDIHYKSEPFLERPLTAQSHRQKPLTNLAPRLPGLFQLWDFHEVTWEENLAQALAQCIPFSKHKPGHTYA